MQWAAISFGTLGPYPSVKKAAIPIGGGQSIGQHFSEEVEPQEHALQKSEAILNARKLKEDKDNNESIFSFKRVTEDFLGREFDLLPIESSFIS